MYPSRYQRKRLEGTGDQASHIQGHTLPAAAEQHCHLHIVAWQWLKHWESEWSEWMQGLFLPSHMIEVLWGHLPPACPTQRSLLLLELAAVVDSGEPLVKAVGSARVVWSLENVTGGNIIMCSEELLDITKHHHDNLHNLPFAPPTCWTVGWHTNITLLLPA